MRGSLVLVTAVAAVALTACSASSGGTSPAPAPAAPTLSPSPEQVGTFHERVPDDGLIGTSEAPLTSENGVG